MSEEFESLVNQILCNTTNSNQRNVLEQQLYTLISTSFFNEKLFFLLSKYSENKMIFYLILINVEKLIIKNNKSIPEKDYEFLLNSFLPILKLNFYNENYIKNKILNIINLLIFYPNNIKFLLQLFNSILVYNFNSVRSFEDKLLVFFHNNPSTATVDENLIEYFINFLIVKNFIDFLLISKSNKKFLVTNCINQLNSINFFASYNNFLLYEVYYLFYLLFNDILSKSNTNISLLLPNYDQLKSDLQNTLQLISNSSINTINVLDSIPKEVFSSISLLAHVSMDFNNFSSINLNLFNSLNFNYIFQLIDSIKGLINNNFGYIFINFEIFSFFFLYTNLYSSVIVSNFNTTSNSNIKINDEIFSLIIEIFNDILNRKTLVFTSNTSQYYNVTFTISNYLLNKLNSFGTLSTNPSNIKSEKFPSLNLLSNGNLSMLSSTISSSLQQTITSSSNSSTNFFYYFLMKKYYNIVEMLNNNHLIFYNDYDHEFYNNFINYYNLTFDFINLFVTNFLEKILTINFTLYNVSFFNLLLNFFMLLFNFTCNIKLPSILNKLLTLWKKIYYNDNIKMFLFSNTNINEKLIMHLLYCTLLNYNKNMNELIDEINDELAIYLYGDPHIKELVSNIISLKIFVNSNEKNDNKFKLNDQLYSVEEINSDGVLIRNEIFEIFTYMIDLSGISQLLLDETNKLIKTLIEEDKNFLLNNSKVLDLIYLLKILPLCTNTLMNNFNTIELINRLIHLQNGFVSYIIVNHTQFKSKLDVISLIININQCLGQLLQSNISLITLEAEELFSTGNINALANNNTNIWANVGDLFLNTYGNLIAGIININNWSIDFKEFSLSFFILLNQSLTVFSPFFNSQLNPSINSNLISMYNEKYIVLKNNLINLLYVILPDINLFNSNNYNINYSIDILSLIILSQEILMPNQIASKVITNFNVLINFFCSQFEDYLNITNNVNTFNSNTFVSLLNANNLNYYRNNNNILYDLLKKIYYYINFLNILIKNSNFYNNSTNKLNLINIVNELSSNFVSLLYILMNLQTEYWQQYVYLKLNICSCSTMNINCNCSNNLITNFANLLELNISCLKIYLIFSTNLLQCLGKKNYLKFSLETLEKFLYFIFLCIDYKNYKENYLVSYYPFSPLSSSATLSSILVPSNSSTPMPYNFINFNSFNYLPLYEHLKQNQLNLLKTFQLDVLYNTNRPTNPLVISLFSSDSGGLSLILLVLELIKTQAESTPSNSSTVPHIIQLIQRFYSSILSYFSDEKICSELLQSVSLKIYIFFYIIF